MPVTYTFNHHAPVDCISPNVVAFLIDVAGEFESASVGVGRNYFLSLSNLSRDSNALTIVEVDLFGKVISQLLPDHLEKEPLSTLAR